MIKYLGQKGQAYFQSGSTNQIPLIIYFFCVIYCSIETTSVCNIFVEKQQSDDVILHFTLQHFRVFFAMEDNIFERKGDELMRNLKDW